MPSPKSGLQKPRYTVGDCLGNAQTASCSPILFAVCSIMIEYGNDVMHMHVSTSLRMLCVYASGPVSWLFKWFVTDVHADASITKSSCMSDDGLFHLCTFKSTRLSHLCNLHVFVCNDSSGADSFLSKFLALFWSNMLAHCDSGVDGCGLSSLELLKLVQFYASVNATKFHLGMHTVQHLVNLQTFSRHLIWKMTSCCSATGMSALVL